VGFTARCFQSVAASASRTTTFCVCGSRPCSFGNSLGPCPRKKHSTISIGTRVAFAGSTKTSNSPLSYASRGRDKAYSSSPAIHSGVAAKRAKSPPTHQLCRVAMLQINPAPAATKTALGNSNPKSSARRFVRSHTSGMSNRSCRVTHRSNRNW
jgi:hypothetical protein